MIKFSIIIPVYNIESYIEECVYSVLKQSYDDFEIIIVNDGSTDGSLKVIKEIYQKHPQKIKIIDHENEGLSAARNYGLLAASGEYIMFLDGDDYWSKDILSELVVITEKGYDVIIGNGYTSDYVTKIIEKNLGLTYSEMNGLNKEDMFLKFLNAPYRGWTVWMHIYRREFIINEELYLREGVFMEDVEWTYKVILRASTIGFFEPIYYYYRAKRLGSITNNSDLRQWRDLTSHCEEWLERSKSVTDSRIRKKLDEIHIKMNYKIIRNLAFFNQEDRDIGVEIVKNSNFIHHPTNRKDRFVKMTIDIVGFNNYLTLIKNIQTYKNILKKSLRKT